MFSKTLKYNPSISSKPNIKVLTKKRSKTSNFLSSLKPQSRINNISMNNNNNANGLFPINKKDLIIDEKYTITEKYDKKKFKSEIKNEERNLRRTMKQREQLLKKNKKNYTRSYLHSRSRQANQNHKSWVNQTHQKNLDRYTDMIYKGKINNKYIFVNIEQKLKLSLENKHFKIYYITMQ